ncbi:hypothetical protein [Pseudosporangium ferrugineum]|uniref:Uncharacterized protein n=1 Tax=Pseudosporangium ferrugineum TaxID=439699 RepID=A0A2T0RG95_9ACTN|nr:hypothetical protein [Pseudosporangium ferrugineum]PRY20188.1 hypothetical protein CLV70_12569 [Pseudosporangium ferrugineum]
MPTQTRRAGGFLLWFAVLGGALAWALHLVLAWGVDELTCRSGNTSVGGIPIRGIVGAGVVVPALITLAALLLAWRGWRRATAARDDDDDPRMERTGMMLLIGMCANALFLSIIAAGGAAVLVLSPCQ